MAPKYVLVFIWFLWLVSWVAASGWAKATVKKPRRTRELPYRLLQGFGFAMLFASLGRSEGITSPFIAALFVHRWDLPPAAAWCAAALGAGGFAFAWWARLHLGTLWSSSVTRKEDHRVVETGPYRIVRHPIYAGLLAATVALAAVSGTLLGLIGLIAVTAGVFLKARLEERFLSDELDASACAAYRARVPMLIPGLPV